MKPIIGVMPLVDEKRDSLWMLPGYLDGIREAGGLPIMLPLTEDRSEIEQLVGMCDGLLFTGGHDVSPQLYNQMPSKSVECCGERDGMELIALNMAISEDMPVLGICRGIQFINVALGGSLYQDIPNECPSSIEHHQSPPYDVPAHKVSLVDSPLYDLIKSRELRVNSYHHQAVKEPGKGLKVMATAPDGLVEGVYCPESRFLWGVQWHPEFSWRVEESSRLIFSAFVEAGK